VSSVAVPASPPSPTASEERRLVTALFCDLVGFTPLSESLDPEEVRDLQAQYFKAMSVQIARYGGTVEKYAGDAVLALFGAPIAHEDDAERALRAALAMRERLESFNERWLDKLKEPLALHTGISSGMIVATNVGSDLRMSYNIIGDTVNVASRLEGVATSGQIVVSQSTYRLTRGVFDFRPMEPIQVKGRKGPPRGFRIDRGKKPAGKNARPGGTYFAARRPGVGM